MKVLQVDHVQLAMPAGQEAGVAFHDDDPLDGDTRVFVDDPFGNRIELMEPNPVGRTA
jgi:catechol 2,3-dioxygenase-like lactoylglutathione lyase family enzyme